MSSRIEDTITYNVKSIKGLIENSTYIYIIYDRMHTNSMHQGNTVEGFCFSKKVVNMFKEQRDMNRYYIEKRLIDDMDSEKLFMYVSENSYLIISIYDCSTVDYDDKNSKITFLPIALTAREYDDITSIGEVYESICSDCSGRHNMFIREPDSNDPASKDASNRYAQNKNMKKKYVDALEYIGFYIVEGFYGGAAIGANDCDVDFESQWELIENEFMEQMETNNISMFMHLYGDTINK